MGAEGGTDEAALNDNQIPFFCLSPTLNSYYNARPTEKNGGRIQADEAGTTRLNSFRIDRDHWQPRCYKDFLSPGYFEHRVQAYTNVESFVRIHPSTEDSTVDESTDEDQNDSGSVPLFRRTNQSGQLESIDFNADRGLPMALRISMSIVLNHLNARIQREISNLVDKKTTTSEQVERIRSLLEQYGKTVPSKEIQLALNPAL